MVVASRFKQIIKNIKEEYTEEENKEECIAADIASVEETTAIKEFKHFIEHLFEHTDTPRKGFDNKDLIQALKHYSLDEIALKIQEKAEQFSGSFLHIFNLIKYKLYKFT